MARSGQALHDAVGVTFKAAMHFACSRFKACASRSSSAWTSKCRKLGVLLRGHGIDLILVPSLRSGDRSKAWSESRVVPQRVPRNWAVQSWSALLRGNASTDLVDDNLGQGRSAHLLFAVGLQKSPRMQESEVFCDGFHCSRFTLPLSRLTSMRRSTVETNPSLIRRDSVSSLRLELL